MQHLSSKEKEQLRGFALSEEGELVRKLIEMNIEALGDVQTIESDPIESRKRAISYLKDNLLSPVQEVLPREQKDVETWE